MIDIFQISGIIGLLLITGGVIIQSKQRQDHFFLFGGLFLLTYSISIGDVIFITLQAVYIIAVLWDLIHSRKT